MVADMMARGDLKPKAMLSVLYSQVSTPPDALHEISVPILVVSGAQDNDNGSAENLAAMFAHARSDARAGGSFERGGQARACGGDRWIFADVKRE